jgi:hypothetical protein
MKKIYEKPVMAKVADLPQVTASSRPPISLFYPCGHGEQWIDDDCYPDDQQSAVS